jgi:hypothetical protein
VTRDLVLKKEMMACCMTDMKKGWRADLVVRLVAEERRKVLLRSTYPRTQHVRCRVFVSEQQGLGSILILARVPGAWTASPGKARVCCDSPYHDLPCLVCRT